MNEENKEKIKQITKTLKTPVTDLRYLVESLNYIQVRINQLQQQKKQIQAQIDAARMDQNHVQSILEKLKKAGG